MDQLNRRQGHTLGYGFLAACVGFVGHSIYMQELSPVSAFGAVVSGIASFWLLQRLYLNDPEAVEDYKREIRSGTLSAALKKFSVKDAVRIVSHADVRRMLSVEVGFDSLAKFARVYTIAKTRALVDADVVGRSELTTAAHADVRSSATFTTLWTSFDGQFVEAYAMNVFDNATLLTKLMQEYSWVDRFGSLIPSGPPPTHLAGDPLGVFAAAAQYAQWSCDTLRVSKSFWQTVLRTCIAASSEPFTKLLRDGLATLHDSGFIDVAWAQTKFLEEAQAQRWSLWVADSIVDLRRCLRTGLILPETIADIFAAAVPVHPLVSSANKESSIIEFALYWEAALRRFPRLMPSRYHAALQRAQTRYRDALRLQNDTLAEARALRDRVVAHEAKETAERNFREANRLADARFAKECIDIHQEFVRNASTSNAASATVSCTIQ